MAPQQRITEFYRQRLFDVNDRDAVVVGGSLHLFNIPLMPPENARVMDTRAIMTVAIAAQIVTISNMVMSVLQVAFHDFPLLDVKQGPLLFYRHGFRTVPPYRHITRQNITPKCKKMQARKR